VFDWLDALFFLFYDHKIRNHDLDLTERCFRIPHWPMIDAVPFDAASAAGLETLYERLRSSARRVSSSMTAPT